MTRIFHLTFLGIAALSSAAVASDKPMHEAYLLSNSTHQQGFVLSNPLDLARSNALVSIPLSSIAPHLRQTDSAGVLKPLHVMRNGKALSAQWFQSGIGNRKNGAIDTLLVQTSFAAKESAEITLYAATNGNFSSAINAPQTYAELGVRVGGSVVDDVFKGGEYVAMQSFSLPSDHSIGNKFFKYEGFGWESAEIGYRYYYDNRGAIDVFGKTTDDMVLQEVGLDGDDYHALNNWGMDVLKVGNSVGLGAVAAAHNGRVHKVTAFDSSRLEVSNQALASSINVYHEGWQIGDTKHDLHSRYRIFANSPLTEVHATTAQGLQQWATGIVNHGVGAEHAKAQAKQMLSSVAKAWCYIASYGKQSLNNDNLGMAVFYPCDALQTQFTDKDNIALLLSSQSSASEKPSNKASAIHYYFMADWEAQSGGAKNKAAFIQHVDNIRAQLNAPILVNAIK